jgi:cytochrome oxidase Cu insertion factor (SCO1/SenC/PrrC family)
MTGMGGSSGPGDSSIVAEFHHALADQGAIILVLVAVLFIGWNQLRSMQYRRAVARGESFGPPPPDLPPEPSGRRFLRIAFGFLWLFDGLLQLQSGMPTGLPSGVIQPAAATSPGWVRHLVDSGLTLWTNHPAAAAASTVWIQVGIGILLLVAPRGPWSRGAGAVSVVWGLVVWSVGNAFGGIFAPGLTLLFGAPGAVLFYVVAGVLVALPDRSWTGRTIGRVVVGGTGVLLLGFGVLQAWPGRGFWQGSVGGGPGTLAGMVDQMAQTSQPSPLASSVSSFASFDRAHGWGVNLAAVVIMLAVGAVLLGVALAARDVTGGTPVVGDPVDGALATGPTPVSGTLGRLFVPAMVVLAVACLADWVLVEDFGFWGGVGTDPNSMLPLLFVAYGGYLALTRPSPGTPAPSDDSARTTSTPEVDIPVEQVSEQVSGPVSEPAAEPVGVGAPAADVSATGPPAQRAWWEGIDSRRAGRIAATVGALGILLVGVAPMAAAAASRSADPQIAVATDGAPNVTSGPAPAFSLTAPDGATVSLASLRGSTVVLTFLDPVCTTDCPIIAQELRVANTLLGADATKVRFVAIAANPFYHSVQNVADFNRQEGLDNQSNWLFLTGSLADLRKVWNAYGETVQIAPAGGMVAHADVVYVIDAHGSIRRILNSDPGAATSSTESSFAGLLAGQVTQVLHQ